MKHAYFTFKKGTSNKHYFVSLVKESDVCFKLLTAWGKVGQTPRENPEKRFRTQNQALAAFVKETHRRSGKGYVEDVPGAVTKPKWWGSDATTTTPTLATENAESEPETKAVQLRRPDADWAF